jgi:glycosyltransferase involved in cell wall biosynthesis
MTNKHNVWIDLTDMLVWQGHYTGIQRVTYAYAERYARDGAKFFAFDKIDNRFFEINFDVLHADEIDDEVSTDGIFLRSKLRHLIGRPYYALPSRYRAGLRPFVHVANHITRTALDKIAPVPPVPSPYGQLPAANFSKGDVVILIGAGWNEDIVLRKLCEIKSSVGIKISQHINDILPIYQPQLFADELPKKFTPYVYQAVKNVDIITVISEATKRDLLIFCKENKLTSPVIKVIRLGDDSKSNKAERPANIPGDCRFILSVGTFEIRKNYILLYQAVKLGQLEARELPKIVIAGRKGWLTDDLAHVLKSDPFVKDHIIWLNDVKDEELAWLYQNCLFTVFPSLAEGWGLPVVESLQNGKLCLASGVSSMLEIGDGMVDYFLPYDPREVLEKITYYLFEDRYKAINDKIKSNYKTYTWDESYQQFYQATTK